MIRASEMYVMWEYTFKLWRGGIKLMSRKALEPILRIVGYHALLPPSITIFWPFIYKEASEQRN